MQIDVVCAARQQRPFNLDDTAESIGNFSQTSRSRIPAGAVKRNIGRHMLSHGWHMRSFGCNRLLFFLTEVGAQVGAVLSIRGRICLLPCL